MEVVFNNVNYSYNYGTVLENKALDNVSLSLNSGLIHGIIGPSGSGKTTMIELIGGLILPESGTVKVGNYIIDKKLNHKNFHFEVGLVFQFPEEQFFCTTVAKEIEFAARNFSYHLSNIKERTLKALEMVGLNESYLNRNPFMLSAGEKRKVAIASILIFNPKIIIFDEPTVGLDYKSKVSLLKLIKKLKERYQKTIIVVTHDIDAFYKYLDNVVVFNNSKVILSGTKEQVFRNIKFLQKNQVPTPKLVEFTHHVVSKTGIKLGNHDDIKELIKAVYRNV